MMPTVRSDDSSIVEWRRHRAPGWPAAARQTKTHLGDGAQLLGIAEELGREFAATAAEFDRAGAFPHANIERLRAAGLLGLATPRRYGGNEAGLALALAVVNAISRGEPSTGLVLAQQYLFHAQLRANTRWPEAVRERVSAAAVGEGALVNAFRVEPELGTPVRGGIPATTARKVAGARSTPPARRA